MKFLFKYNIIAICITRLTVMFKVFLNHFIGYIARTPCPISYRPKMSAPISLTQFRIFFLEPSGCPSLQSFHKVTKGKTGPIFNMDMHMIFTYYSFKYFNIFCIANLLYQVSASFLYISFKNFISIFCNPYYVSGKPRNTMVANTLLFTHKVKLAICVATESLALKAHSFN